MKVGDRLTIEHAPYRVEDVHRGRLVLKRCRRDVTLASFNLRLRARRYRRPSVSATFLVDLKTGKTISNYEMLAIGVPSKRVERLLANLPLLDVNEATPHA